MVGPDPAGRIVRAAPGWNRPERPPFLRPPRPVELPHVGIALGTRPQPVRRPRASPRRAGLRLPRHPDVALLLAGLFRIARRLDLDGNTRRAPRHLHRGRALLGPRTEARGPRGPSTDLETVKLRKENITSRADRLLKDGRTATARPRQEGCIGCRIRKTKSRPLSHRPVRSWSRCSRSHIARTRARPTGPPAGASAVQEDPTDGTSSGGAPETGSMSSKVPLSVPVAPGANHQGATGVASPILHSPDREWCVAG